MSALNGRLRPACGLAEATDKTVGEFTPTRVPFEAANAFAAIKQLLAEAIEAPARSNPVTTHMIGTKAHKRQTRASKP